MNDKIMPPAGGEPEVVCYEYVSKCGNKVGFGTSPVFRVKERGEKNPLVRLSDHRAHVTRLQAEVELWRGRTSNLCIAIADVRSELTKARELLKDIQSSTIDTLLHDRIDTVLSNQSAPADKVKE